MVRSAAANGRGWAFAREETMTKETLGYVKLEWVCPSCGTRNPGPQKLCANCGTAQPADVHFEEVAQDELLTDEAEIAKAKAGPDIHCAYCGTRNPAGSLKCSRCGAELKEGTARATGRVVGKYRTEAAPDVTCPSCGATNPANAAKCAKCGAPLTEPAEQAAPAAEPAAKKAGLPMGCLIIGALAVGAIILFMMLATRTKDVTGEVAATAWKRVVAIDALVPVQQQGWRDEIPQGATLESCREELRYTQKEPAAGAIQVCGTPYKVDTGSGYAEVVQDCVYQVYDDRCRYTVLAWTQVDQVVAQGQGDQPYWPAAVPAAGQRQGAVTEVYEVVFDSDGERYTYRTDDPDDYARFAVGSEWVLSINSFGDVTDVQPGQ